MKQQTHTQTRKAAIAYEFGTFEDRLAHACAALEIDRPNIEYEDGEPLLTDNLVAWLKEYSINMDWLFCGSATALVKAWSKSHRQERAFSEVLGKLDDVEQDILRAGIQMMVERKVDANQFTKFVFEQIDAHRAEKAA